MKTLRDIGENALLRQILPRLPLRRDVLTGPGDDCAVVRIPGAPHDYLFTTDPVIEHRHFLPDTPPRLVGRKAIARAVSDIAAMGGTPLWTLVNLVAPAATPLLRIRSLYHGMIAAAKRWDLSILGGDTAEGDTLELHITCVGCVPRGTALLRSGARPGDLLYVTGTLGGAWLPGSRHHLLFEPRLEAGRFLAGNRFATAAMDLSDGLAADLPRLLDASRCGALVDAARLPLAPNIRKAREPLRHALGDGEDFELLFTVSRRQRARFEAAWTRQFPQLPATRIGQLLASPRRRLLLLPGGQSVPLRPGGFQHFRSLP